MRQAPLQHGLNPRTDAVGHEVGHVEVVDEGWFIRHAISPRASVAHEPDHRSAERNEARGGSGDGEATRIPACPDQRGRRVSGGLYTGYGWLAMAGRGASRRARYSILRGPASPFVVMLRFAHRGRLGAEVRFADVSSMRAETFGGRLRRLRTECGFTIAGLARRVLVTEAAIRNLETGDSKGPSFLVGVRLADALCVNVHYLAFGEGASLGSRVLELERRMNAFEQLHLEEHHRRENP